MHVFPGKITAHIRTVMVDAAGVVLAQSRAAVHDNDFLAAPCNYNPDILMEIEITLRMRIQAFGKFIKGNTDELAAFRAAFAAIFVCHVSFGNERP